MKASQQAIERGVKDCVFIDYKRRSGHFDVTTVASIKEITEKVNNPITVVFLLSFSTAFKSFERSPSKVIRLTNVINVK